MPTSSKSLQAALYPAAIVLALGLFVATRDQHPLVLAAVGGLAIQTLAARSRWTPGGALGWANAMTWLRIAATAGLLCRAEADLLQVALAFTIFALDGVDGAIARARNSSSLFGAELDKECDAFFVLSVCALLWLSGSAGLWVLIAGLWRYAYGVLVALGPQLVQAPRSNWGRYIYSTSSCSLMAAMIPGNPLAVPLAAFATCAISASFGRSIYYSLPRS